MFSIEFWKFFKNIFITEIFQVIASSAPWKVTNEVYKNFTNWMLVKQFKISRKEIYFSKASDLSWQLTSLGWVFHRLFSLNMQNTCFPMVASDSEVF